jgi:hypothetical protein
VPSPGPPLRAPTASAKPRKNVTKCQTSLVTSALAYLQEIAAFETTAGFRPEPAEPHAITATDAIFALWSAVCVLAMFAAFLLVHCNIEIGN